MEGTPEQCFIFNDSVNGVKVPEKLDKQWYVATAKDRLKGFGVQV
jgi:DNA polymerase